MLGNKRKREEDNADENPSYFSAFSSFVRRLSPRQNVEKDISLPFSTVAFQIAKFLKQSSFDFVAVEASDSFTIRAAYGVTFVSGGENFAINLRHNGSESTKVNISASPRIPTALVDCGQTARQIDAIFAHLQKIIEMRKTLDEIMEERKSRSNDEQSKPLWQKVAEHYFPYLPIWLGIFSVMGPMLNDNNIEAIYGIVTQNGEPIKEEGKLSFNKDIDLNREVHINILKYIQDHFKKPFVDIIVKDAATILKVSVQVLKDELGDGAPEAVETQSSNKKRIKS